MTYKGDISAEKRALIHIYYNYLHCKVKDIQENLKVSRASIYRIVKNLHISNRKSKRNVGRERKINVRMERVMVRCIQTLSEREGNFTSKRLRQEMGFAPGEVSTSTIIRMLKRKEFNFVQARRKGVLSPTDF